jgi:hypothetical protein
VFKVGHCKEAAGWPTPRRRAPVPPRRLSARARTPPEDPPSEAAPSPCPRACRERLELRAAVRFHALHRGPLAVAVPEAPSSARWSLGGSRVTYKAADAPCRDAQVHPSHRPCCSPAPGRAAAASSSFPGRIAQLWCPTPPLALQEPTPAARCFPRPEARRNWQPRRPPPPAASVPPRATPLPNRAPNSNPSRP